MKTLKGMALSMIGLVAAIAAVAKPQRRCLAGCSYPAGFSQRLLSCVRCLSVQKRTNAVSGSAAKSSVLPTTPMSGGMHGEMSDVR